MLRANDLIWSFVVNNYLMGKDPFPFDLLFWNADATRMPAAMHSYYLRNMYQKNLLAQPGGLTIDNVPIDLRKITIPVYLQAGKEDHIAPAKSVYKATQIYSRAGALHAGGLGPYRGRRQSAAQQEVPALAERDGEEPADARRMAGGREGVSRLVVERLGQVAVGASPAPRCRRACRAQAACRRSRMRPAAT